MDIGIKSSFHLHPHLLLAALPRSPFQFLDLAQNDLCLGPDLVGAFNLLPVARLYFFLPLAVNPPPRLAGSFSPRPTERLVSLAIICIPSSAALNAAFVVLQPVVIVVL